MSHMRWHDSDFERKESRDVISLPQVSKIGMTNIDVNLKVSTITEEAKGRLRLDPLPTNPAASNATFLDPYIALPSEDGAIAPILAALTAFNAASAQSHWMQLEAAGNKEHDPRYYIKETTRRLQAYYQITDVIHQLACLLELVTGSTIFVHIGRPERVGNQGQRPVIFCNRQGREDSMVQSLNVLMDSATAWAELQSEHWITHQRLYTTSLEKFRNSCARQGVPIHRQGDYPLLARFGSSTAETLVDAIRGLDWAAYGQPVPSAATTHPIITTTTTFQTQPYTALGSGSHDFEIEEDDTNDDNYVGRRATRDELQAMLGLGLSATEICEVRLMLWEKSPAQWHDRLFVILQSDHRLVFSLLGKLEA
ncbi:hypothetical protein FRC00_005984 [Tulasnella sp. 408]|nr:hypothetical protein FRC00_005984 [Tulasnella sp. 408]